MRARPLRYRDRNGTPGVRRYDRDRRVSNWHWTGERCAVRGTRGDNPMIDSRVIGFALLVGLIALYSPMAAFWFAIVFIGIGVVMHLWQESDMGIAAHRAKEEWRRAGLRPPSFVRGFIMPIAVLTGLVIMVAQCDTKPAPVCMGYTGPVNCPATYAPPPPKHCSWTGPLRWDGTHTAACE